MSATTFATYNIHYGVGLDERCDLDRVVRSVRDCDVIGFQEVDRHWARSGNQDQLLLLKQLLPQHHAAWGPNVDVLKNGAGGAAMCTDSRRQFGNLILSRFPIISIRNHPLPKYGAASLMDMQRGVLETVLQLPSRTVRVYCTHLCHLSDAQRKIQAQHILDIHTRAVAEGSAISGVHPTDPSWSSEQPLPPVPQEAIVLGDFNADPNSTPYMIFAGDRSPRFGYMARNCAFIDAWRAAGHEDPPTDASGATPGATRYKSFKTKTGRRVDYCFVSSDLAPFVRSAAVLAEADGSDHQPLIVNLDVP